MSLDIVIPIPSTHQRRSKFLSQLREALSHFAKLYKEEREIFINRDDRYPFSPRTFAFRNRQIFHNSNNKKFPIYASSFYSMKNKAIFIEGYQDKKYRLIRLTLCNPFPFSLLICAHQIQNTRLCPPHIARDRPLDRSPTGINAITNNNKVNPRWRKLCAERRPTSLCIFVISSRCLRRGGSLYR